MDPSPAKPLPEKAKGLARLREAVAVFREVPGTVRLVWEADRVGTLVVAAIMVVQAVLPAALAWVGKLIIDAVVKAAASGAGPAAEAARHLVLQLVGVEFALMIGATVVQRLMGFERELLKARLGQRINVRILEKALELELRHFEDSEVYDKMQNARREASERPLALVLQAFSIVQNLITLIAFAGILVRLSPWSVAVIVAASVPAFVAEARLSRASFRLNSWRAPEGRRMNYLEWILTRDSHVKEVKLFQFGRLILDRYQILFRKFYAEDRALALRRVGWGLGLGLVSLAAFYGCYVAIARRAASGEVTLGDMALYLTVFRQGQNAFQTILSAIGSMYENALFMSNLFLYLAIPTGGEAPRALPAKTLPPGRRHAIEFQGVSFRYPGKTEWALQGLDLTLHPGEKLGLVGENGAGKSTLIKLLLRLYDPTEGRILYGGVDLRDLEPADLRQRIGAVYQDFVRYQFSASDNIGLGHPPDLDERAKIVVASERGGAHAVVEALPQKYDTVLGGWFEAGQELSAGQWQKLAVARAFMRDADVLILDEPTASIDAEAEHELFRRFQELAADRIAIVISHRFSTVRIADRIAVLAGGRVEELGSHQELMAKDGRYARLFRLQARGYLE